MFAVGFLQTGTCPEGVDGSGLDAFAPAALSSESACSKAATTRCSAPSSRAALRRALKDARNAWLAGPDGAGAFAALMPGAQGLGQIVGPNLAASILAASWGYSGVFLLCGAAAITGLAVYAAMYLRLRKIIPALANAFTIIRIP